MSKMLLHFSLRHLASKSLYWRTPIMQPFLFFLSLSHDVKEKIMTLGRVFRIIENRDILLILTKE